MSNNSMKKNSNQPKSPRSSRMRIPLSQEEIDEEKRVLERVGNPVVVLEQLNLNDPLPTSSSSQPTGTVDDVLPETVQQREDSSSPELSGEDVPQQEELVGDAIPPNSDEQPDPPNQAVVPERPNRGARRKLNPPRQPQIIQAIEEDAPEDTPDYTPIFFQERTVFEMKRDLTYNSGITYSLKLGRRNCEFESFQDPKEDGMWNAFLHGESPYGGGMLMAHDDPRYCIGMQYGEERFARIPHEKPETYDWTEDITEREISVPIPAQDDLDLFGGDASRCLIPGQVRKIGLKPDVEEDETHEGGAVIYSPPTWTEKKFLINGRYENRAIISSSELPQQLRRPIVLRNLARKGLIILTDKLEEIDPVTTYVCHYPKSNFMLGYYKYGRQNFEKCKSLVRKYDCILRTCKRVINCPTERDGFNKICAALGDQIEQARLNRILEYSLRAPVSQNPNAPGHD